MGRIYYFHLFIWISNIFSYSISLFSFSISLLFSITYFTIINLLTFLLAFLYWSFLLHLFRGSYRIIFWKSIHLEVASGPFCLLVNSPWLLVFALVIISFIFVGFNIYCWTGIHFSWSNILIFIHLNFGFIYSFHIWSRD